MRLTTSWGYWKISPLAIVPVLNLILMRILFKWRWRWILMFIFILAALVYLIFHFGKSPFRIYLIIAFIVTWFSSQWLVFYEISRLERELRWIFYPILLFVICIVFPFLVANLDGLPVGVLLFLWFFIPVAFLNSFLANDLRYKIMRVALPIAWIVIIFPLYSIYDGLQYQGSGTYENRVKLTLRAIGSSQLKFSSDHNGNFGSWDELQGPDLIQKGYTRTNIIDNYSLVYFHAEKAILDSHGLVLKPSTFTIIALPRSQRNKLRTFAIDDSQTPHIFVGKELDYNSVNLHDRKYWKPLR
jgi:hypothetical protein